MDDQFPEPDRRPRILIVEDEALVAITLEDCVSELGYDCVGPFFNVTAALPTAQSAQLDAAILDIKFGDVVSYELPEILAARNIPFGFASGFLQEGLESRWSDRPYMSKPYQVGEVRQMLLTLLPARA